MMPTWEMSDEEPKQQPQVRTFWLQCDNINFMKKAISFNKQLETLCDVAMECQTRIQQDFEDTNPIVGVNQRMRETGVPVDIMMIDCSKSKKRIVLILHDHHPDMIRYQFSFKDKDPDEKFEHIPFNELTADKLYNWIKSYFSSISS